MVLPIVDATICLLRKGEKTLFTDYRNYPHGLHQGFYASPGGKVNPGESKEECVKREILEETGIILHDLVYRGEVLFNNEQREFGGKKAKHNYRVHYFDSFSFNESSAKATEGEIAWVKNDEIHKLPMHEGDKAILELLNKYKEINVEVIQDSKKLINVNLISFRE